ncbi:hypothetical protein WJX82_010833 [Trebouxia sp. C0006]
MIGLRSKTVRNSNLLNLCSQKEQEQAQAFRVGCDAQAKPCVVFEQGYGANFMDTVMVDVSTLRRGVGLHQQQHSNNKSSAGQDAAKIHLQQMLQRLEGHQWCALYMNGISNTSALKAQTTASALQRMLYNDFGSNIHVGYTYNPTFATGNEVVIYAKAGLRCLQINPGTSLTTAAAMIAVLWAKRLIYHLLWQP